MTDPADTPEVIISEILSEIEHAATNRPRDLQRTIGASALGTPCTRWLMHMIAGHEEPHRNKVNWQAWVGVQMHAEFENIFRNSFQTGRYLVEQRVLIGVINGQEVWGNVDLFDTATGTVIDHKSASKGSMVKYEREIRLRNRVGPKYETQLQSYGLGMLLAGHKVTGVANIFYPRDGEFGTAFHYYAPFDAQIALAALARCNQLADQIATLGFDEALTQYPECGGKDFCPYCPYHRKEVPAASPDDPFGFDSPPKEGTK